MRKKPKEYRPVNTEGIDWTDSPASSLIARFAYKPRDRVLVVEFINGSEYQYFTVPRSVFDSLSAAPSKGQFFCAAVRDRYPYRRSG